MRRLSLNRSEPATKSGQNIPKNRCRTTIAERIVETRAELPFIGDQIVCLSTTMPPEALRDNPKSTERNGAPYPTRRSGDDDNLAFEQHRALLHYQSADTVGDACGQEEDEPEVKQPRLQRPAFSPSARRCLARAQSSSRPRQANSGERQTCMGVFLSSGFLVCCRFFVGSGKGRSSSRRLRSGSRSARKVSRDRNASAA